MSHDCPEAGQSVRNLCSLPFLTYFQLLSYPGITLLFYFYITMSPEEYNTDHPYLFLVPLNNLLIRHLTHKYPCGLFDAYAIGVILRHSFTTCYFGISTKLTSMNESKKKRGQRKK